CAAWPGRCPRTARPAGRWTTCRRGSSRSCRGRWTRRSGGSPWRSWRRRTRRRPGTASGWRWAGGATGGPAPTTIPSEGR
ncbi:MAG: hypothetical protein AVDCRST_MAG08-189, partial [uncultured Acetobacteraceae bacterium]